MACSFGMQIVDRGGDQNVFDKLIQNVWLDGLVVLIASVSGTMSDRTMQNYFSRSESPQATKEINKLSEMCVNDRENCVATATTTNWTRIHTGVWN